MKGMFNLFVAGMTLAAVCVAFAGDMPQSVEKKIKEYAEDTWPDDHSTQLYYIKQQKQAFTDLASFSYPGVPEMQILRYKSDAKYDFPDDYSTQLYYVRQQVKAYLKLKE